MSEVAKSPSVATPTTDSGPSRRIMRSNSARVPLVIMPGAGSELYRGLGAVVVGGLALSSVITLILTPLVFAYAIELVVKVKSLFGLKEQAVTINPDIKTRV